MQVFRNWQSAARHPVYPEGRRAGPFGFAS
jgi:hypothetical protein